MNKYLTMLVVATCGCFSALATDNTFQPSPVYDAFDQLTSDDQLTSETLIYSENNTVYLTEFGKSLLIDIVVKYEIDHDIVNRKWVNVAEIFNQYIKDTGFKKKPGSLQVSWFKMMQNSSCTYKNRYNKKLELARLAQVQ